MTRYFVWEERMDRTDQVEAETAEDAVTYFYRHASVAAATEVYQVRVVEVEDPSRHWHFRVTFGKLNLVCLTAPVTTAPVPESPAPIHYPPNTMFACEIDV